MSLSRKLATLIIEKRTTLEEIYVLLAKYKMLSLLPSIKQALLSVSSQVGKQDTIEIESPFPLSNQAVEKVKSIVGNTSAKHEVVINKNALAGFKARFKGILYDGSAERIIKQFTSR